MSLQKVYNGLSVFHVKFDVGKFNVNKLFKFIILELNNTCLKAVLGSISLADVGVTER